MGACGKIFAWGGLGWGWFWLALRNFGPINTLARGGEGRRKLSESPVPCAEPLCRHLGVERHPQQAARGEAAMRAATDLYFHFGSEMASRFSPQQNGSCVIFWYQRWTDLGLPQVIEQCYRAPNRGHCNCGKKMAIEIGWSFWTIKYG